MGNVKDRPMSSHWERYPSHSLNVSWWMLEWKKSPSSKPDKRILSSDQKCTKIGRACSRAKGRLMSRVVPLLFTIYKLWGFPGRSGRFSRAGLSRYCFPPGNIFWHVGSGGLNGPRWIRGSLEWFLRACLSVGLRTPESCLHGLCPAHVLQLTTPSGAGTSNSLYLEK